MNSRNSSPTSPSGHSHRGHRSSQYTTSRTTGRAPVIYQIEERRKTLPVTSNVHPQHWDLRTMQDLFASHKDAPPTSPIAYSRSQRVTQYLAAAVMGDNAGQESHLEPPRMDPRRSRRISAPSPTPRHSRNTDNPFLTPVSPNSPSRGTTFEPPRGRVLFYHKHDPHYGFTNFSAHPVIYKHKKYPTSEHLFQSFKFQKHRPGLAEHIRTCSERPSVAFSEARRFQPEVRKDWKQVNIEKMDITLWHKFTQHADLRAELLATGNDELVEDSDKDAFWGVGPDGKGLNHLGKALERLRTKLRDGH